MYTIQVIEDFTLRGNANAEIRLNYDKNRTVNLDKLKSDLTRVGKHSASLFEMEYNESNPRLGNTNVAFLESTEREGGAYKVNAIRGDYKMVGALRGFVKKNYNKKAEDLVYRTITPIGLGVFAKTRDNQFLVSRRGDGTDVPGSLINTWVGNLDQDGLSEMPGIKDRLRNRAMVKANLFPNDYSIKEPLAIVRDKQLSNNPTIVKSADLWITADEAKASLKEAKKESKFADNEIMSVEIDEVKATKHLRENMNSYVGNGLAAILYGLKGHLGQNWFDGFVESNSNVFRLEKYSFRKRLSDKVL